MRGSLKRRRNAGMRKAPRSRSARQVSLPAFFFVTPSRIHSRISPGVLANIITSLSNTGTVLSSRPGFDAPRMPPGPWQAKQPMLSANRRPRSAVRAPETFGLTTDVDGHRLELVDFEGLHAVPRHHRSGDLDLLPRLGLEVVVGVGVVMVHGEQIERAVVRQE